jgi:hypothetical protein
MDKFDLSCIFYAPTKYRFGLSFLGYASFAKLVGFTGFIMSNMLETSTEMLINNVIAVLRACVLRNSFQQWIGL